MQIAPGPQSHRHRCARRALYSTLNGRGNNAAAMAEQSPCMEGCMATTTTAANNFVMRLIGAAALDTAIYEEVEADRTATGQALVVVVLSSLAAGIGARGLGGGSLQSIVFISIVALMAWAAWALVGFAICALLM